MKFHIITIGSPKLQYSQLGWAEYFNRLRHYHQLSTTHIPDKKNNAATILETAGNSYKVGLVISGKELSSPGLAEFLDKRALAGRELSFIIGGPDGLPQAVIDQLDFEWSFGKLTFPHDLAMVVLLEALYRASTIQAGQPYHR